MCLYPELARNRKYLPSKKNGGAPAPPFDARLIYTPRECGRCMECMRNRAKEWQVRLCYDVRDNRNGKFVTLTFSDEKMDKLRNEVINENYAEINRLAGKGGKMNVKLIERCYKRMEGYELENEIAAMAVRRFYERWRKMTGKSIRHFLVTELGHNGTERLHLHGILWTDESMDLITEKWEYGFVYPSTKRDRERNYVSERSVNYIIKYIRKMDFDHLGYVSKIFTSSGIGKNYTESRDAENNKYIEGETDEAFRLRNGRKVKMPRYWRNKIYDEEEREKLWLEKLDREERFVMGRKIDIKEGLDGYYKALKMAQKQAIELGYGGNRKQWELEEYDKVAKELREEKKKKS